jgi:hypothetical protein
MRTIMPEFGKVEEKQKRPGRSLDSRGFKSATADHDTLILDARTAVEEAEKKIAPPRISEGRCHVCQHPFRDWIEMLLIKGMAYKTIGDRVSPKVDRRSISNHYKNHLDLQDAAIRAILEHEADVQGQNYEEGLHGAITKRGVLEIALRRGFEDIQNKITTVEPRDLIQITKLLAEMDTHSAQAAVDEARAQVHIFILAIKNVLSDEQQAEIAEEVKRLRKHEGYGQEFEKIMEKQHAIPEVVDAVVVDA